MILKQNGNKKYKKPFKPHKDVMSAEDIDRWLKQHSNLEKPRRGKKNSLGDKKKRRH